MRGRWLRVGAVCGALELPLARNPELGPDPNAAASAAAAKYGAKPDTCVAAGFRASAIAQSARRASGRAGASAARSASANAGGSANREPRGDDRAEQSAREDQNEGEGYGARQKVGENENCNGPAPCGNDSACGRNRSASRSRAGGRRAGDQDQVSRKIQGGHEIECRAFAPRHRRGHVTNRGWTICARRLSSRRADAGTILRL